MARRGSANWAIAHYGKPCIGGDIVSCQWYPGLTKNQIKIHDGTQKLWQALGAVMLAYNYRVPTSYVGAYACRNITGGNTKSMHSWPLAMDINAKTNPFLRTPTRRTIKWGIETDMPAAMVREIEMITASGIQAFYWLGRARSIKDAMHYQVQVTLGEIQGGVYSPRGFYYGDGSAPIGDEMSLRKGDSGNAVKKHQEGLNLWNVKLGLDEDGDFGPATESATKQYQKAADLDQNGVIDGVTSALIIAYTIEGGSEGPGKHTHPATTTVGAST